MQNTLSILVVAGVMLSCHNHTNSNTHAHLHEHSQGHHSHAHAYEDHDKQDTDYFKAYSIEDMQYGTKTKVTLKEDKRIMITNALPNHDTGRFPGPGNPNTISAQQNTYTFPLYPKFTGQPKWVREPGVALNGVKFEPGTAEVVACDSGENYRVEAFQELVNLGLDFNNAHVQPTGAYHYHGTPTSIIEAFDTGQDLVHVGFAHDGFPMYYSKSGKYKSSYTLIDGNRSGEDCTYDTRRRVRDVSVGGHHDGTYTSDFEYVEGLGDLDECNGMVFDGKYMYLVTAEFPYISRCLMGEVSHSRRGRGQRQGPNFERLFAELDVNNDGKLSKTEAKGPAERHFSEMDANADGFLELLELQHMPPPSGSQKRF